MAGGRYLGFFFGQSPGTFLIMPPYKMVLVLFMPMSNSRFHRLVRQKKKNSKLGFGERGSIICFCYREEPKTLDLMPALQMWVHFLVEHLNSWQFARKPLIHLRRVEEAQVTVSQCKINNKILTRMSAYYQYSAHQRGKRVPTGRKLMV